MKSETCTNCGYFNDYYTIKPTRCIFCMEKIMGLRNMQSKFARMTGLLILYATELGYELTYGDAYAKSGHKDGSFHYKRLAVDLNLFKDGEYLTKTEDHEPLGVFWEGLGGTWGGRFDDGNHYSLGE